jgi:hypothetical protein
MPNVPTMVHSPTSSGLATAEISGLTRLVQEAHWRMLTFPSNRPFCRNFCSQEFSGLNVLLTVGYDSDNTGATTHFTSANILVLIATHFTDCEHYYWLRTYWLCTCWSGCSLVWPERSLVWVRMFPGSGPNVPWFKSESSLWVQVELGLHALGFPVCAVMISL